MLQWSMSGFVISSAARPRISGRSHCSNESKTVGRMLRAQSDNSLLASDGFPLQPPAATLRVILCHVVCLLITFEHGPWPDPSTCCRISCSRRQAELGPQQQHRHHAECSESDARQTCLRRVAIVHVHERAIIPKSSLHHFSHCAQLVLQHIDDRASADQHYSQGPGMLRRCCMTNLNCFAIGMEVSERTKSESRNKVWTSVQVYTWASALVGNEQRRPHPM